MAEKLILVVDDSPLLRRMIAQVLQREGYRVETAADGEEALRKIQELAPDIVLLDVVMPNKDGYQVVRELHRLTQHKPRVILLTGVESGPALQQARALGVDDILPKPFSPFELSARVRGVSTRCPEHSSKTHHVRP